MAVLYCLLSDKEENQGRETEKKNRIIIRTDAVYKACDKIEKMSGAVIRGAGSISMDAVIAFVEAPDSYKPDIYKVKLFEDK